MLTLILLLIFKYRQEKNEYIKLSMESGRKKEGSFYDLIRLKMPYSHDRITLYSNSGCKKHNVLLAFYKKDLDPFYISERKIAFRFVRQWNEPSLENFGTSLKNVNTIIWEIRFNKRGKYESDCLTTEDAFLRD